MAALYFIFIFLQWIHGNESVSEVKKNDFTLFVFKGSDWCSNCKRFEMKITADTTFSSELGRKGIQIQELDFPQKKKLNPSLSSYNDSMAEVLGFNGDFPGIILFNKTNNKKEWISYKNESVNEFKQIVFSSKQALQ